MSAVSSSLCQERDMNIKQKQKKLVSSPLCFLFLLKARSYIV